MEVNLDSIRRRVAKATQEPWIVSTEIDGVLAGRRTVVMAGHSRVVTVGQTRTHHRPQAEANIELIAHAPDDLLALCAEVERLRAGREIERAMLRGAAALLAEWEASDRKLRKLHQPHEVEMHGMGNITWCTSCPAGTSYPCPTLRALDGVE